MTTTLESLFNLPSVTSLHADTSNSTVDIKDLQTIDEIEKTKEILHDVDSAMSRINIALPTVRDLDASDDEMDELAKLATDNFSSLMDLSLNVDPRFSGPIIQSASALLGHAVTAKIAKMDKKLKMIDLQLKKAKLDQQVVSKNTEETPLIGEGTVIDRTELLREILANKSNQPHNAEKS